jgi:hypothetical protein
MCLLTAKYCQLTCLTKRLPYYSVGLPVAILPVTSSTFIRIAPLFWLPVGLCFGLDLLLLLDYDSGLPFLFVCLSGLITWFDPLLLFDCLL